MSIILDPPKFKCDNCDKFSPVTSTRGKDIVVGCACKKLCDSLEKLEKKKEEIERKKEEESPYISKWEYFRQVSADLDAEIERKKKESQYISKWKYILDDNGLQAIFMPVTLPKKKFYHDGCPATTDLRITTIKFYDGEYKFCPDCGEMMIIPKYAEDVKS